MNLRAKFIWDTLIVVSILIFLWTGWQLYQMNIVRSELQETYALEQVGTDQDLQNKINQLEKVLSSRNDLAFRISKEPTELTAVVSLDGENFKYYGVSSIIVTAIVAGDELTAIINHKDRTYRVKSGDTVAGGVITSITPTEVRFLKNEMEHIFTMNSKQN